MKTPSKIDILFKIWNISIDKHPIEKRYDLFWEKRCMYSSQSRQSQLGGMVSELNRKLWKNARSSYHTTLQTVIRFKRFSVYATHIFFELQIIMRDIGQPL